jgi:phasin family protein
MANPNQRQAEKEMSQAAQEGVRKTAEETARAARVAADAGAGAARAGADVLQRQSEAAQDAWNSSAKMVNQMTERTMENFARVFGMGGERTQQAAEQSSRNAEAIVQSTSIIAGGVQSISKELFDLTQKQLDQNVRRMEALVNSRSPQEILAVQSDLFRDNLESFVQSTRRISEISMQMADEAARRMNDLSLAPR